MPKNLYDDAPGGASEAPPAPEQAEGSQKEAEGKTQLLNSDICPGMKAGDEMVLKIVKVHEGEYEVAYAPEPEDKEEETPTAEEMPPKEMAGAGMPAGNPGGGYY